jgi:hypothetical protein
MTKQISRRLILNATISLLLITAGWLVTKTVNSKTIAHEQQTLSVVRENSAASQPKQLLTARHAFQQPAQGEKTIGEARKNIKVLNAYPESQLIPMMNFFAASLGVKCNYCHVLRNGQLIPELDEKPEKSSAREMIAMTLNINKTTKDTKGEVSCFSCHRGRTSPVSIPSLPLPSPTPRPAQAAPGGPAAAGAPAGAPAPAATMPTADDILNKYIAALGGQAALDNLKTRVMKGTYAAASGLTATYEVDQAAPDRFHVVFTTPQGTMERGFNGSAGWEKNPRGVMDMPSDQLAQTKAAVGMFSDIKLKEQFTRMNVRKDKLDGKDVYVIVGTTAAGRRERLYFDAESGLLLRRTTATQTPVGVIPQEVNFEDYRDVDGVKVPFTIRTVTIDAGSTATRKYTEIKANAPVDESIFNKPPAPPAATPAKP